MKYAFVYIPSCIVLVSIGGFAMYHFSVSQPFDETISLLNHPTPDCVGYIPKAKALAENSIGQARYLPIIFTLMASSVTLNQTLMVLLNYNQSWYHTSLHLDGQ